MIEAPRGQYPAGCKPLLTPSRQGGHDALQPEAWAKSLQFGDPFLCKINKNSQLGGGVSRVISQLRAKVMASEWNDAGITKHSFHSRLLREAVGREEREAGQGRAAEFELWASGPAMDSDSRIRQLEPLSSPICGWKDSPYIHMKSNLL